MPVRVVLTILSVALLGFAPAPFRRPDRHRADPTDLSGTWELVSSQNGGRPEQVEQTQYLCEVTKSQFVFVQKAGRKRTATYAMRLEPQLAPPAFTWSRDTTTASYVGSYRLRQNELTLIFTEGSSLDKRPTDFEGTPTWRYVLRRGPR